MSARDVDISLRVNGEDISARVEARQTLVDFLRVKHLENIFGVVLYSAALVGTIYAIYLASIV